LKRELNDLRLPPNASLITFDAVLMYTNIDIDDCIDGLSKFLPSIMSRAKYVAIIDALDIVMRHNCMRFGDLIFHQICGVAMGMSPTPTIANYTLLFLSHRIFSPSWVNTSSTTRGLLTTDLKSGCTMRILQPTQRIGPISKLC
jgi:hypothetical protein